MITLFTGAGASKPLKYPTAVEFFAVKGRGKDLQTNDVYRRISGYLKEKTPDVEEVLRLLDPYDDIVKTELGKIIVSVLEASSSSWIKEIPSFVGEIERSCCDKYGRRPSERDVKNLYLPLLECCNWKTDDLSLFTTNYDPVTDVIMEMAPSLHSQCFDGFDGMGKWYADGYSEQKKPALSIYRLHGSMSWVEHEGQIRNTRDYSPRETEFAKHLIIYPGFKGNPEEEGHQVFRFAHEALRKELQKTKCVVFIGYSFRDAHLNKIFAEGLGVNDSLRMVIWNPAMPSGPDVGLKQLRDRFRARIVHLAEPFGSENALEKFKTLTANQASDVTARKLAEPQR